MIKNRKKGIECLQCTDAVLNSSLPSTVKLFLSAFESTYRTPECENALTADAASDVTLNTCTDAPGPGQVNRYPSLIDKIELPIHFHVRGCFIVEQSLGGGGCYRDKRIIDQQRGALSNVLKGISFLQLGEFNGVLCINGPNNLDAWGTNGIIRHAFSWATVFLCAIASIVVLNKTY
ncbi:unnamed protein product [Mytilus coruscus]|uniref:Uncharacterized protein n=1 Tax=Mytilus coruscus TaxID=42192 RepID=A0A6J8EC23_MYTCO|nr:unnamed protein product [Mytilus coruscus]